MEIKAAKCPVADNRSPWTNPRYAMMSRTIHITPGVNAHVMKISNFAIAPDEKAVKSLKVAWTCDVEKLATRASRVSRVRNEVATNVGKKKKHPCRKRLPVSGKIQHHFLDQ